MQQALTSSRCPTLSAGGQIHTHINIYVCTYTRLRNSLNVFTESQALPWVPCFPLSSQMCVEIIMWVLQSGKGWPRGGGSFKDSEFDGRVGNRSQAASTPKFPS